MTSMDSRRSSVSMLCTALGPFFLRYSTSARLLSMMWPSANLQPDSAAWANLFIEAAISTLGQQICGCIRGLKGSYGLLQPARFYILLSSIAVNA